MVNSLHVLCAVTAVLGHWAFNLEFHVAYAAALGYLGAYTGTLVANVMRNIVEHVRVSRKLKGFISFRQNIPVEGLVVIVCDDEGDPVDDNPHYRDHEDSECMIDDGVGRCSIAQFAFQGFYWRPAKESELDNFYHWSKHSDGLCYIDDDPKTKQARA